MKILIKSIKCSIKKVKKTKDVHIFLDKKHSFKYNNNYLIRIYLYDIFSLKSLNEILNKITEEINIKIIDKRIEKIDGIYRKYGFIYIEGVIEDVV